MARTSKRKECLLISVDKQPYIIPANWCWISVGSINQYKSESVEPKKQPNSLFELYSVPSSAENYPEIVFGKEIGSTKQAVEKGDVLLCKINPRINRVWEVSQHTNHDLLASSEWIIIRNHKINSSYLMYCFRSPYFRDYMLTNVSGVGGSLMRAQPKYVKEYPIPLPPFAEQQRIVERIESLFAKLDEAKEKAQSVVDGFENRKAAILHKAFTGELTAEWRETKRISYETWVSTKLSDECEINPPKLNVKALPDDMEVSFFPMPSLSEVYGAITEPQIRQLKEVRKGFTNFSEGDVVFAKITPCMENGKSAVIGKLVNDIGFGTTEFFVLRCGKRLFNRFLWHLVRARFFRDEAKTEMTGAVGQQRVPKSFIENYSLHLPTVEEQIEIVNILDECFEKEQQAKEAAERVIEKIDIMKKSILARAFRGELGTNDPNDEPAEELLKRVL